MEIVELPLNKITISSDNTRKDLLSGTDEINLDDLAHSIQEFGLLSPLIVTKKQNKYEIIAGQRRFLACQKLHLQSIPCIVKENMEQSEAITLSLIENVQRVDMSPIDKSEAYKKLLKKFNDIELLSNYVGVGVPTIRKYISLLNLSPVLQQRIDSREGTIGVDALSKLGKAFPDHLQQETVYDKLKGFNQKVQIEMIKRTEGEIDNLDNVVTDAQIGIFDMKVCSRGLCDLIPPDFEEILREELQKRRKLSWLEFFMRVASTASTGIDLASFSKD